jgi:ferritin
MLKTEHVTKLVEQYKKEIDAYYAYKDLKQSLNGTCRTLDSALEEIMYDEYLHARFLREYLKSKTSYQFPMVEETEKRFLMIEED